MRLDGKVALVTGAGSGIGRAVAIRLASEGASVILVGRRVEALETTLHLLPSARPGTVIAADIADPEARAELIHKVGQLGRLHLLVNNAGVVEAGPLDGMDAQARRRMVETNLIAPMELTVGLLPLLEMSKPARIVNVGSMFGDIAFPFFAGYSATKFGLRGWSDALRRELAPRGIQVTYAAPRGTRTPAADGFSGLAAAFKMRMDHPDAVARLIVGAIIGKRRDAYPQGIERLFLLVQKLRPSIIDGALLGDTLKVLKAKRLYP